MGANYTGTNTLLGGAPFRHIVAYEQSVHIVAYCEEHPVKSSKTQQANYC